MPAASSLPRAASWARNSAGAVNAYFDQDGNFIGSSPEASSSGKFFARRSRPAHRPTSSCSARRGSFGPAGRRAPTCAIARATTSGKTPRTTRACVYNPPPGIPRELYVQNLAAMRGEIGGSSYVIAELDSSFTKLLGGRRSRPSGAGRNAFVSGSYVWSHYYGNVDQDNSAATSLANDGNIFIGSSNIADGGGRQLWDRKYGDLRGDRRHQLKVYGYYALPWNASVGAFAIYQSGQPWEKHDYRAYPASIRGTSTSDTNRYAEPAGSRTAAAHHQLDLNYVQDFPLGERFRVQARVDVFNVYDRQTGYDIQDNFNSAGFGTPQSFFDPRRFQLSLRFELE